MILIKKDILLTKIPSYKQNGYFCLVRSFQKLFDFYLNASIHVALAVYAFMRVTEVYFDLPYNENLNYFVFYATITGYNFVKYFGIAKFHHRSLTQNLKIIQIFSFICFVMLCFYGFKLSIQTLLLYGIFGLLTMLYAVPFLSGFQKSLRSISYLKVIVVAFVWAGVTVLVPLFDTGKDVFTIPVVLQTLQRFLLVCVLILPFDIRDLQFDAISLQTLPRKIGIENTKKVGYILMLIVMVLEFLIAPLPIFRSLFLVHFFLILFLLMRSNNHQPKYYSSFFVEAIPIVWWLIFVIIL